MIVQFLTLHYHFYVIIIIIIIIIIINFVFLVIKYNLFWIHSPKLGYFQYFISALSILNMFILAPTIIWLNSFILNHAFPIL